MDSAPGTIGVSPFHHVKAPLVHMFAHVAVAATLNRV